MILQTLRSRKVKGAALHFGQIREGGLGKSVSHGHRSTLISISSFTRWIARLVGCSVFFFMSGTPVVSICILWPAYFPIVGVYVLPASRVLSRTYSLRTILNDCPDPVCHILGRQ